jgi:hypothetical protein
MLGRLLARVKSVSAARKKKGKNRRAIATNRAPHCSVLTFFYKLIFLAQNYLSSEALKSTEETTTSRPFYDHVGRISPEDDYSCQNEWS